ncbi:hypothetical protein K503DRAFT_786510, partial [Rhizopogon vinicolor AM-OR11-026]
FLLGVGKVVKEASAGALNDSGQPHSRTVNFDNEEVFLRTPEVDRSGSRRSQDGRGSVESRRSWDPSTSGVDLSRRVSAETLLVFLKIIVELSNTIMIGKSQIWYRGDAWIVLVHWVDRRTITNVIAMDVVVKLSGES